jgi:hypothetical protein
MEEHKEEVYERIPWEAMGQPGGDKQWWILGLAAAIVAGALGYSFMSNRPAPLAEAAVEQSIPDVSTPPNVEPAPAAVTPVAPPAAPTAVAEADLFAAAPLSLATSAENHAVWFVREYLASDGSGTEDPVLRQLLPADLPVPVGDALVFVEWAGVRSSEEVAPGRFRVDVIARYLEAAVGEEYQRADPVQISVEVDMTSASPTIASAPTIAAPLTDPAPPLGIGAVPEAVAASAIESVPGAEVLGGIQAADGSWNVVLVVTTDGINRPVSLSVGQ